MGSATSLRAELRAVLGQVRAASGDLVCAASLNPEEGMPQVSKVLGNVKMLIAEQSH